MPFGDGGSDLLPDDLRHTLFQRLPDIRVRLDKSGGITQVSFCLNFDSGHEATVHMFNAGLSSCTDDLYADAFSVIARIINDQKCALYFGAHPVQPAGFGLVEPPNEAIAVEDRGPGEAGGRTDLLFHHFAPHIGVFGTRHELHPGSHGADARRLQELRKLVESDSHHRRQGGGGVVENTSSSLRRLTLQFEPRLKHLRGSRVLSHRDMYRAPALPVPGPEVKSLLNSLPSELFSEQNPTVVCKKQTPRGLTVPVTYGLKDGVTGTAEDPCGGFLGIAFFPAAHGKWFGDKHRQLKLVFVLSLVYTHRHDKTESLYLSTTPAPRQG